MEIDKYEHGVPSWVDHSSADPTAAGRFYAELLGWDVQAGGPEMGGYAVCRLRGKMVAGIGAQQEPGPAAWATYVNVDDADAVIGAVTEAGGKPLFGPMDVMDLGRMAIFADPAGAVLGLWQPAAHRGAELVNEPGAMCWNELVTTDVDGARQFYRAVFGWDSDHHADGGPPGGYTEWKLGGRVIGGMMAKPPGMPAEVPPHWSVYFAVTDADATMAKAVELGARVLVEAADIDPGRFGVLLDPAGAPFDVIALAEHSH